MAGSRVDGKFNSGLEPGKRSGRLHAMGLLQTGPNQSRSRYNFGVLHPEILKPACQQPAAMALARALAKLPACSPGCVQAALGGTSAGSADRLAVQLAACAAQLHR